MAVIAPMTSLCICNYTQNIAIESMPILFVCWLLPVAASVAIGKRPIF